MLILNISHSPCSYFSFFEKWSYKKLFTPEDYQNTKFHGPVLSDASFAFTSEVSTFAILEWLQLQH
jgi:hypothetical protein